MAPPIPVNSNTLSTIALVRNGGDSGSQKADACFIATREVGDAAFFGVNSAGDLIYGFNDDPASYNFDPGLVTPPGSWAFVAETVAADQAVLYLDDGIRPGLQEYTNVLAAPVLPLKAAINIGGDLNVNIGQDRTWNGGMDEVAYFTRTLSPSEIGAIHDALFTAPVVATPPTLTFSLSGGNLILSYAKGTLQSAPEVTGTFTDVSGSAPPSYTAPMTGARQFFRVRN